MNETFSEVEKRVGSWLQKNGYEVIYPPTNHPNYDLICKKDGKRIAVQVKDDKSKIAKKVVQAFSNWADESSKSFDQFYFVANIRRTSESNDEFIQQVKKCGFVGPIFASLDLMNDNLKLFLFYEDTNNKNHKFNGLNQVEDNEHQIKIIEEIQGEDRGQQLPIKIAMCTLKGGVGKTTSAVHIAGSFTLRNYNVALVDANPEQYSLLRLLDPTVLESGSGEGILLHKATATITCFKDKDFKADYIKGEITTKNYPIVIFDCSPSPDKESNDPWIFQNSDFCLIPVTLNPLGLGKNVEVIEQTIDYARKLNPKIHCVVFENSRINSKSHKQLIEDLTKRIEKLCLNKNATFLANFVRFSQVLYFWGEQPQTLAHDAKGANSHHPRQDFYNIVEELMEMKVVEELKNISQKSSSRTVSPPLSFKELIAKTYSASGLTSVQK
jgi:chromosome partitioning protein